MSTAIAKTIVATGATSGLGFEMVKQLLSQVDQPYRLILGARDTAKARTDFDSLGFDAARHSLTVLPLELTDLAGVRTFAKKALEDLGRSDDGRLDYLVLNAAAAFPAETGDPNRSKWCDAYTINYLSQHYLTHLLREKLVASRSRIVVVSTGAVQNVPDPSTLADTLKLGSGATSWKTYPASKFLQLLTAHWWRRELHGVCDVVAVSPGMIPGTGLGRGADFKAPANVMSSAKSISTGASSILEALFRKDFPDDPDRIFLTSWGEWWPASEISASLDKQLQNGWSPSKGEIEREASLPAE
ncbi:hypothetical protein RB598_003546 [Gaeumannomyces tritici]